MNLYFRFILVILKNILRPAREDVFTETSLDLRVLPNDLDANMHMNNGRFLTIMDIGRTDFTMKLGLHKTMIKHKWGAVATAINVIYLKPLNLFDKYQLKTKLLAWDGMWFYMEQRFVKDGLTVSSAIVKATFLKGGKRISPKQVIETSGVKPVSPEFPAYLKEMVEGEEAFVEKVKAANKAFRKK